MAEDGKICYDDKKHTVIVLMRKFKIRKGYNRYEDKNIYNAL